jgi:diguanylate cyclase (GGDEF)-like protein
MQKLPDQRRLSGDTVAALFPFHLLCSTDAYPRLLSAGTAISKVLPDDFSGAPLQDYFTLKRPCLKETTTERLIKHSDSFVVLESIHHRLSLRGQFVPNSETTLLFLGSLLVSAADSLLVSGFSLKDFAPFDTVPEVLILHKFREMQLCDLEKKQQELSDTMVSLDDLSERANTDELTQIPNRRGFLERCESQLKAGGEPNSQLINLMVLLDLDQFKAINDTFGHAAGDQILVETGQRLQCEVESIGSCGRLGGDEFAALVTLSSETEVELFLEKVRNALVQPIAHQRVVLQTGLSIGVASAQPHDTVEQLLYKADVAMYAGRDKHRGQTAWYTHELQTAITKRAELEVALQAAIDLREIVPYYQPIVSLDTLELEGFETLARWHHPDLGAISPATFIALAGDLGLLQALDELMLDHAMAQLQQWCEQGFSGALHVNLSGPTLTDALPEALLQQLRQYSLAPHQLVLELTETSLLDSSETTIQVLQQLAAIGVGLQLDDFGTGYSALTHLLRFPVNGVKLDRSYVKAAAESRRSRALLAGLIELARSMDIGIVAEGIEDDQQLHMLRECGCPFGQGYLFGHAVPADDCAFVPHSQRRAA